MTFYEYGTNYLIIKSKTLPVALRQHTTKVNRDKIFAAQKQQMFHFVSYDE